jgi:hypothetical protein
MVTADMGTVKIIPIRERRSVRDHVAEALRRRVYGLVRPLWAELPDENKATWLEAADGFIALMASVGLKIVAEDRA